MARHVVDVDELREADETAMGPQEQKRECPVCRKVCTLRGLYGHLRLAHKKSGKQISELVKRARGDRASEVEELFGVLDQLEQCTHRLGILFKLDDTGSFEDEGAFDALKEALDAQIGALRETLKEKGIDLTDEYLNGLSEDVHWDDAEDRSEERS